MLRPLQDRFPASQYPDLIVGLGQPDDAAVYRISGDRAIVQTVDFFPPVVDDPYAFGAIAAANSLSDIYAMGGEPAFALNICAFPDDLDPLIITAILQGGADKVAEAGAAIAGGHTVKDREPKYGLAVTGFVNPAKLVRKGGAKPGDILVLTKPLGVGVITTAIKREIALDADVQAAVVSMSRLNRNAGYIARELGVQSATDITGYGLIGHSLEMADQSRVRFVFTWTDIPFLPGAELYAEQWIFAGGAESNASAYRDSVEFLDNINDWQRMLLFDPQTSGGLLLALAPDKVSEFADRITSTGESAWIIGAVEPGRGIRVD